MIDLLAGPIVQIFALVGGAVVAFFFGYRRAGKVRDAKESKKRLEDIKKAQDIRDEIESDPYLVDRARKWVRSDKR